MIADLDRESMLARLHEYRRAARAIVLTEHASVKRRCLGLLDLADMARREDDPTLRHWSEVAIWAEAAPFLGIAEDKPPLPPESFVHRQRRLRLEGEEICSRCLARIATEEELGRWSELRIQTSERQRIREGAIK